MGRRGKRAARRALHLAKIGRSPPRRTPLQSKWRKLFGGAGAIVAGTGIGRSCSGPTAGSALLLFAGFANERFAGEAALVALDGEHLYQGLAAQLQLLGDVAGAKLRGFR